VNIKFIYPDGEQGLYPELFSYSTFPEYAVTSRSSPQGGAAAQVLSPTPHALGSIVLRRSTIRLRIV
jgi:hypothetical protein